MAAKLGELGVRPAVAQTILQYSDKKWGKFSEREDKDERLRQLLYTVEEKRPIDEGSYTHLKPLTLSQLKEQSPEISWLIQGLLAKQTYGLITGSTGVGKTQLALQIGLSLSKGLDWDNNTLVKSRVLFGSHEMGHNELAYFLDKIQQGMVIDEEHDIFHVLPVGQPVSLINEEGRDFYLQFVDDYDVFIFDTVSSSTHLSMLDDESAPGIVAFFNKLTAGYGKTVIALGHDRKEAVRQKNSRAEDMYGARILMDKSSVIIRLEKHDEHNIKISYPKVRLAKEPLTAVFARDPTTLWLTRTGIDPHTKVTKVNLEGGSEEFKSRSAFG